nr:hypothetical protein [Parabacteroides distasonis]
MAGSATCKETPLSGSPVLKFVTVPANVTHSSGCLLGVPTSYTLFSEEARCLRRKEA